MALENMEFDDGNEIMDYTHDDYNTLRDFR